MVPNSILNTIVMIVGNYWIQQMILIILNIVIPVINKWYWFMYTDHSSELHGTADPMHSSWDQFSHHISFFLHLLDNSSTLFLCNSVHWFSFLFFWLGKFQRWHYFQEMRSYILIFILHDLMLTHLVQISVTWAGSELISSSIVIGSRLLSLTINHG